MSWPDSSLREQYETYARTVNDRRPHEQAATNEAEIRSRQSRQRVVPSRSVANDLVARLGAGEAETKATIAKGRSRISQDAGKLSENY